ncbi:hypothetical protein JOB18_004310 [Solea senegalensis]|uniref:Uncharacterized protein n=1 Tax=Solea senegalensis TaxID=28829 RepID=A0AAV6T3I7_SOLSE|nr:hypothetical protein JOB18_004310 [Solea senegalensis]
MEESYETFEEELRPQRADPPPLKPVRQICRPEMYTTRKTREVGGEKKNPCDHILTAHIPKYVFCSKQNVVLKQEMAPVPQHTRAEARTLREPSFPRTTSLHKTMSTQNLTQIETPWENVTLNRCLFVAITILVLTSGFQKLQETMRGQRPVEEELGLTVRRTGILRHRGQPSEPQTSLWEVMFWWLPDLDDEDDEEDEEDDDGKAKTRRSKKGAVGRTSRGRRNKPLPDRNLMKRRDGKLKDRRAKKAMDEENKVKTEKDKNQDLKEAAGEEDEDQGNEEMPEKKNNMKEMKEKKQTHAG